MIYSFMVLTHSTDYLMRLDWYIFDTFNNDALDVVGKRINFFFVGTNPQLLLRRKKPSHNLFLSPTSAPPDHMSLATAPPPHHLPLSMAISLVAAYLSFIFLSPNISLSPTSTLLNTVCCQCHPLHLLCFLLL